MEFLEFPKMRYRVDCRYVIVNDAEEQIAMDLIGEYCYDSPREAAEHFPLEEVTEDPNEPVKPRRGRPPNQPSEVPQ